MRVLRTRGHLITELSDGVLFLITGVNSVHELELRHYIVATVKMETATLEEEIMCCGYRILEVWSAPSVEIAIYNPFCQSS